MPIFNLLRTRMSACASRCFQRRLKRSGSTQMGWLGCSPTTKLSQCLQLMSIRSNGHQFMRLYSRSWLTSPVGFSALVTNQKRLAGGSSRLRTMALNPIRMARLKGVAKEEHVAVMLQHRVGLEAAAGAVVQVQAMVVMDKVLQEVKRQRKVPALTRFVPSQNPLLHVPQAHPQLRLRPSPVQAATRMSPGQDHPLMRSRLFESMATGEEQVM
ncbi:unnamed protein product [Mycena citricolor]|uniref:Uncharacterized protein n=1 Tax=Mycena citricolor TaxID=2018698 RepID=A0AAD2HXF8_9AGAR|nr:unnamed protein product [Mycena citricolor]